MELDYDKCPEDYDLRDLVEWALNSHPYGCEGSAG